MSTSKMRSHFTKEKKLNEKISGKASHVTTKVRKKIPPSLSKTPKTLVPKKYNYYWYIKEGFQENAEDSDKDAKIARREVVAQEFFRLLIPGHPKTRLVDGKEPGTYSVASKEITEYKKLADEGIHSTERKHAYNSRLKDGVYTGLGEVTTIALLMGEIDFKNGNIAIDSQGRFIKFDGDWCFANLRIKQHHTDITQDMIETLPFPESYKAYNWLDVKYQGSKLPSKNRLLDRDLSKNTRIRAEINHALLKALILPEELIKEFIDSYLGKYPDEAKVIYNEFIGRRDQMKAAAFKNESFLEYLKSETAEKQLYDYMNYLKGFKTTGKNFIFQKLHNPENLILSCFDNLRKDALSEIIERKGNFLSTVIEEDEKSSLLTTQDPIKPNKPSGIVNWVKNNWKPIVAVLLGITAIVATVVTAGIAGAIGAGIAGGILAASSPYAMAIGAVIVVAGTTLISYGFYTISNAYQRYKNKKTDIVVKTSESKDANQDALLLKRLNSMTTSINDNQPRGKNDYVVTQRTPEELKGGKNVPSKTSSPK